jgi:hypothetical protein
MSFCLYCSRKCLDRLADRPFGVDKEGTEIAAGHSDTERAAQ